MTRKKVKYIAPITAVMLLLILLVLKGSDWLAYVRGGAASESELVELYLAALTKKDPQALRRLVPKDHEAAQEIEAKVALGGGCTFEDVTTTLAEVGFGPRHKVAKIIASCSNFGEGKRSFSDSLNLEKIGSRWFIILGKYKGPLSVPVPGLTAPAVQ